MRRGQSKSKQGSSRRKFIVPLFLVISTALPTPSAATSNESFLSAWQKIVQWSQRETWRIERPSAVFNSLSFKSHLEESELPEYLQVNRLAADWKTIDPEEKFRLKTIYHILRVMVDTDLFTQRLIQDQVIAKLATQIKDEAQTQGVKIDIDTSEAESQFQKLAATLAVYHDQGKLAPELGILHDLAKYNGRNISDLAESERAEFKDLKNRLNAYDKGLEESFINKFSENSQILAYGGKANPLVALAKAVLRIVDNDDAAIYRRAEFAVPGVPESQYLARELSDKLVQAHEGYQKQLITLREYLQQINQLENRYELYIRYARWFENRAIGPLAVGLILPDNDVDVSLKWAGYLPKMFGKKSICEQALTPLPDDM